MHLLFHMETVIDSNSLCRRKIASHYLFDETVSVVIYMRLAYQLLGLSHTDRTIDLDTCIQIFSSLYILMKTYLFGMLNAFITPKH